MSDGNQQYPFPVTLDHQELIKINRNGDEIATINFNTSYASSIGAKMVNKLDELFVAIEEGTYKKQIILLSTSISKDE